MQERTPEFKGHFSFREQRHSWPTAWACYESLRYYRSMRRRQTLGLADPIVVNRFLLWSIWTGAATFLPLVALTIRALSILTFGSDEFSNRENIDFLPVVTRVIRFIFLIVAPVAALTLSLSFFPPRAYIDRIRLHGRDSGIA